eukprot:scaffold462001_cov48-Prasinocladus_malaysianus.AAC.1
MDPSSVRVWWELKLLQECCNLGTLRSAIKHKRLVETTRQPATDVGGTRRKHPSAESDLSVNLAHTSSINMGTAVGRSVGDSQITAEALQRRFGNLAFEHDADISESIWTMTTPETPKPVSTKQDLQLVLPLLTDIAEGMAYLHSLGVVHGDLKASNVLLQSSQRGDNDETVLAKVADFGTSILLSETESASNFFAGTPTHMAPEVLATSTVSRASDVYSFAVTIYETVTGLRPYPGRSTKDIMYGVVHYKLRPSLAADLPR